MKVLRGLILICLGLSVYAHLQRDQIAPSFVPDSSLFKGPIQSPSSTDAFKVDMDGNEYRVKPRYNYDIKGLVVKTRSYTGKFHVQKSWGKHLGVMDLCLLWGENLDPKILSNIYFKMSDFTCIPLSRDRTSWSAFDPKRASYNHLLSDDPLMRERLGSLRVGDQIHLRGILSEYSNHQGLIHGTSVRRSDTGPESFETIYVEHMEVISPQRTPWDRFFQGTLFLSFILLMYFYFSPRAYRFA